MSKLVFLVAKLKPLVAKQNGSSFACGALINFSMPRALYHLAMPLSLDQLLRRVVLTIEGVKKWVLAILTSFFLPSIVNYYFQCTHPK